MDESLDDPEVIVLWARVDSVWEEGAPVDMVRLFLCRCVSHVAQRSVYE